VGFSSGAKAVIVAGATALSAIIGVAIGSTHKTYATAYENPAFKH
jgi:hypothetical protein